MNLKALRLRLVLPLFQMPLAAALTLVAMRSDRLKMWNRYGPPERMICNGINAPALLPHLAVMQLWERLRLTYGFSVVYVDLTVFLVLVGVLWYCVGLEIDFRGQTGRGILPARFLWRIIVDLVLVLVGVLFGMWAVVCWFDLRWYSAYVGVLGALLSVWALVLVGTYGRDLIRVVWSRIRRSRTA